MGEFFSEVAEKGLLAKLPPPKKGKKGGDLFFERFKWVETLRAPVGHGSGLLEKSSLGYNCSR